MKDALAPSLQKRASNTLKINNKFPHLFLFPFLPTWIRIRICVPSSGPDPANQSQFIAKPNKIFS
jgi:hypothetical protein